ncbi:30S ribosomal protein S14 [Candidatus Woesearchaeota archaeon]|nr:30S ribosomal protein S14 [Candidatus Woesearchaeota archaeon]
MAVQLRDKPAIYKKFLKYNTPKPRKYGKITKVCRVCGNHRGHISKYGINICRRCFREVAIRLGFKKFS